MIKMRKGNTLILGLSEENIKRLQMNQPIRFNLNVLIPDQDFNVFIVSGKTEESIGLTLQQLTQPNN
jgi:hypothetical protein